MVSQLPESKFPRKDAVAGFSNVRLNLQVDIEVLQPRPCSRADEVRRETEDESVKAYSI